jgi:DNA segregation ATPase FtsK/SpoIIIE-like protein
MGAQAFIPPSLARPALLERPQRTRGAEACALLLFFGASFLTIALLSYRADPSNPLLHGRNWMGAVGESIASLLVGAFGAAAWWVPAELLMIGAPLLKGRRPDLVALRVAGDVMILVLIASLVQVAMPELLVFGARLPGGDVGLLFGELMRALFSSLGSFLVGLTGIGLILIGRSSFSFIEWCQQISQWYDRSLALGLDLGRRSIEMWRRARALRLSESAAHSQLRGGEQSELYPTTAAAQYAADSQKNGKIVAQLEAESPWIPMESTGAPPLAVSESLRKQLRLADLWDEDSDSFEPAASTAVSSQSGAALTPSHKGGMSANGEGNAEPSPSSEDWATYAFCERSPLAQALDLSVLEHEVDAPEAADEDEDEEVDESTDEENEEAFCGAELEAELDAGTEQGSDDSVAQVDIDQPKIIDTSKNQAIRAARPSGRHRASGEFTLPDTDLLLPPSEDEYAVNKSVILHYADLLEKTLADYGVTGKVEEIHPGPTVTTYELAPASGTKVSKVAGLSDDLALGLSRKVRIIAPIPGKSRIGFEIPNDERVPVNLRELVEDERFQSLAQKAPLPVVLGRDIVGAPFYADLSGLPHVIVAGATGAGKSVGLNVMLASLLFKRSPEELRLLMIDPKVVELAPFDKIPHLLLPVVTDMNQAAQALKWAVDEMERRYHLFADAGTKNITTYNRYVERVLEGKVPPPRVATVDVIDHNGSLFEVPSAGQGSDGVKMPERIPYIVIVVDEFADLIMQQGKEVEVSVARLAQKARAAGMHVILATQRPSVDVITGMIKANFPSRIAFRVAQKVDSRTILDEMGAEVLLGRGDMLVKLNGATDTLRVQCPFVSEEEITLLCDHLRAQGEPKYDEAILQPSEDEQDQADEEPIDARFEEAMLIVRDSQRCSTSWLQRKMTIGYNRAAKMVDMMERRGYVGPPNGSKDREVLLPA